MALSGFPYAAASSPSPPRKTLFADEKSHAHSLRIGPTPMPPMALRRSSMSAIFRSALQFSGAWPVRARHWSLRNTTSSTQWSLFSTPQCPRTSFRNAFASAPSDSLPVEGHAHAPQPPRRRALPQAHAHAERLRAQRGQHAAERVVARNAILQLQELIQARLVLPAVALHVKARAARGRAG